MQVTNEHERKLVENAMTMRYELLRQLSGTQPGRDIDKECGYPTTITVKECRELYDREGIAKRVVHIYADESWKKDPEVYETEDDAETEFEKAWKKLVKKHNIFSMLRRADALSGIGTFGIILLGLDDGSKDLATPVPGCDDNKGVINPTAKKTKLLYMRTFDESCVNIAEYESNPFNCRFGMPKMYSVMFSVSDDSANKTQPSPNQKETQVHWSRVIHIADNLETSNIFGTPRLKDVFNRCYDLRKVLSSSGEMFWKGGFPGIAFETNPAMEQAGEIDVDSLRDEFEKYQNGLQRYLALVGVQAKSLAVQVADPTAHFTTHVKAICISKGIPWRIFAGSEEARLASDQDTTAWNERLKDRQTKHLAPAVIAPFAERLCLCGVLPMPKLEGDDATVCESLIVTWPDLHTPSNADKANVAKVMAEAMANYINSGLDLLMPPEIFLTDILGFEVDRAKAILDMAQEYATETDGMHDHLHSDELTAEDDKAFEREVGAKDKETEVELRQRELDIKEKAVPAKGAAKPAKKP